MKNIQSTPPVPSLEVMFSLFYPLWSLCEMDDFSHYLRVCEEAVRAGGQVLQQWAGRIEVRKKGPADLVTQADFASQEVVRRIVLGAFPSHSLLGEEAEPNDHPGDCPNFRVSENGTVPFDARTEYRWIVDPLDGTTNYVHGVPHYCVSLALGAQWRSVGRGRIRPGPRRMFHGRPGPGGAARRPAHPRQPRRRTLRGVGRRRLRSQRARSMRPTCGCFSKCSRAARPFAAPAPRP